MKSMKFLIFAILILVSPTFAGNGAWDTSRLPFKDTLDMGGNKITNLADATEPTDAANLQTVLEHTGVSFNYYLGSTTLDLTLTESESVIQETQNADPDQLSNIFFVALEADTIAPFIIPAGAIIPVHFDANVTTTAGKFDTVLYVKFGYVDSDGSSNFVQIGANGDSTATLTGTQTNYETHVDVSTEITVPLTKRLYLQVWADSSGGGSYAEINFYFDSVGHHLNFAVGASILEDFVRKTGEIMTGDLLVQANLASQNYRTIWISAAEMYSIATNGATYGTSEKTTNDINSAYFLFDGTTEQFTAFERPFPEEWNLGTIKAKFFWSSATSSTSGDTVEWELQCGAQSDNDAIDAALGTGQVITDTLLANNGDDRQLSSATPALTVGGTPALADMIHCKVSRNVSGTDDLVEDAWLYGMWIQYQEVATAVAAW